MKGIAIYVEGGGVNAQQKAELLRGLDLRDEGVIINGNRRFYTMIKHHRFGRRRPGTCMLSLVLC